MVKELRFSIKKTTRHVEGLELKLNFSVFYAFRHFD